MLKNKHNMQRKKNFFSCNGCDNFIKNVLTCGITLHKKL